MDFFLSSPQTQLDEYPFSQPLTQHLTHCKIFEDGELTIEGFYSRYQEWLNKKKKCFDDKIAKTKANSQNQSSSFNTSINKFCCRFFILSKDNSNNVSIVSITLSAIESSSLKLI